MTHLIPDQALENHIGVLGKTGSGKSNLAKVIAEQLMIAGERVCAIDPTGTWWGLRLAEDGKRPSRFSPVIFGGDHGDIPITDQHGSVLAEAIGTSKDSAIIDTQQMTVGQRTRFFSAFAETLLRANRGPLHLVVDEAHLFAPQGKVNDPQSGAMLHAANNLVSLGRGRGLRIILISQRPAKLHKDSLTQVETLIAMRLIAPQDRNAVKEWVGEWADPAKGAEIIASLPSLPRGDAWVWSPQIDFLERKHFPLAATYDTGQPEANAAAKSLPPIDLAKIGERMDTIRQEAMANDPKRLKAIIADLQRQKPAPAPIGRSEQEFAAEYERGYKTGFGAGHADASKSLGQRVLDFAATFALDTQVAAAVPSMPAPRPTAPAAKLIAKAAPAGADKQTAGDLPPSLQRCVDAVAWWHDIGFADVERTKAAITAGLSPTASTFGVYLGKLKDQGLIEASGPGTIRLTSAGSDLARHAATPDPGDVLRKALALVKAQPARVLQILAETYPEAMSRDDLADRMGLSRTASTLGVYVGECARLGLVTNAGPKLVRAADFLFSSPGAAHDHNN